MVTIYSRHDRDISAWFFLDFIEIAVVVVPIVAPILLADPSANITAVWLGVMIGLNIQTSFLTPPFGFALFYLRGVASKAVKTIEMYKGVVPFIALQLVGLAIVGFNPSLVNYLPTMTFLSSETAPLQKIHVYNSAWKIIYLIFMKKIKQTLWLKFRI